MCKRVFDLSLSIVGTLILSPLLLLIALLVKVSSSGPVLYKQLRVGLNCKEFSLFKFRTMYLHSDAKGLLTVGSKDPRVTSIGYFLRKYKLDELPQLFNVILGDMSLVGPRPEVKKYVERYTREQLRILSVKPGITDLASVYFRNENDLLATSGDPENYYIETVMPHKLELNKRYIENMSVLADIRIIIQTVKAVFFNK